MSTELAVLRALDAVYPLTLREVILHAEIGAILPERPTLTEMRRALAVLEGKRQAVGIDGGEDRGTCWLITEHGRARVAAA